jgi:uncharacterized FlgJ-related protein
MVQKVMKIFLISLILLLSSSFNVHAQDVRVFAGHEQSIAWMESIGWWGEELHAEQLEVPRTLLIAISPSWRDEAAQMPVSVKKEFFYRCLLPLVTHANWLVRQRRAWLKEREAEMANGQAPGGENLENLRLFAVTLRVKTEQEAGEITDSAEWLKIIDELLYRLDEIPAGLAMGQAAYESGWGTSRFTVEGNALFGQWTYGGEGMAPKQQRKELGDHKIAAFTWPFDSVRGYFLNLSTHPAYEDFRKLRAGLRKDSKPLNSLTLADGLISYSERGQEYVDSLKSLIRSNGFDLADSAVPRDEPLAFAMGAANEEAARSMTERYEAMKKKGEFDRIVAEMRLE